MGDGCPAACGCTTETPAILLVVENLQVFRKNCSMPVRGFSPIVGYQMLSNGHLLVKTRAPDVAQVQVTNLVSPVPRGLLQEGTPSQISRYVSIASSLVLVGCYLLFLISEG